MIAIDTNLLVYAHRESTPEHRRAKNAIEKALSGAGGCGIAAHSVAEFWAVVTHPSCERPSTSGEAADFLKALLDEAGLEVWPLSREAAARLPRVASDLGVRGTRIFDLQIALSAVDGGAEEIWTHDRKFVSVPGLPVRDPLA